MSSLHRPTNSNLLRLFALETRCELLKLLRLPAFAIPTLTFPLIFYAFFGLAFGSGRSAGPVGMDTYLLATFGCFGVIGAALFGFGVGVATERGQGWMLLKRATPMPPFAYFLAKILMALLFASLIVAGLFTLAGVFGDVHLASTTWLALASVLVAGALPFCAFGLALGYLCGPNSAPAVINLIYLPMAIASGLWVPIEALPGFFRALAPWLPAYHFSRLALGAVGAGVRTSATSSLLYLALFSAAALAVAYLAYRRDEGATYG